MLFQIEASGVDADHAITLFWRNFEADPEGRAYADEAVRGIEEKLADLDTRIRAASSNWRGHRAGEGVRDGRVERVRERGAQRGRRADRQDRRRLARRRHRRRVTWSFGSWRPSFIASTRPPPR
jgi:hypothetical protein